MKKRVLLKALVASTLFLVSLSSCDNDLINSTSESTIQESTTKESTLNTTEYNTDYNEKLYKKLFNEFKDIYSDTTYDEFIKDVDKTEYEDSINFTYLSSFIVVDLNGNFISKGISVYDDNDILDTVYFDYINYQWIISSKVKIINDMYCIYYETKFGPYNNIECIDEYTYDDLGNKLSFICSKVLNNEWTKAEEGFYINDSYYSTYSIDHDVFGAIIGKIENTYDESGNCLTNTHFKYINNAWVKFEESSIHGDKLKPDFLITFNDDNSYKYKDEYTYDEFGNNLKVDKSEFINNEWINISRSKQYGDFWKEIYNISLTKDGFYDSKIEYTYDDLGNKTSTLKYIYSNDEWVLQN